ncbi:MAG: Xaa-Pro peptidase family protein [Magnetococcus sp. WYHC-3]
MDTCTPSARMIYADSESCADLYYATGFFAPDPFLWVREAEGRQHLVTSVLEIDRARRVAHVDEVHDWEAIKTRLGGQIHGEAAAIGGFLGLLGISQVTVPEGFPLGLADSLRSTGVTLTPVSGAFWPQRARKRPDEVAAIEEALRLTGLGMAAGIDMIRRSHPGDDAVLWLDGAPLTSQRVRGAINATLVQLGAMPRHTIVSGALQGADPHEEGSGPLYAHTPIILDVFPRHEASGYWGDMTRTVCRGQPSERVQRAWQAVLEAQEHAIGRIAAGVDGVALHQELLELLTLRGFPTGPTADGRQAGFFHGTGHGLGLEIHEAPRIGRKGPVLEVGHVVTVEPGLYDPAWGGVRLEDVVVVTESGCRNLTQFAKFFVV